LKQRSSFKLIDDSGSKVFGNASKDNASKAKDVLQISTVANGHNFGRTYRLRVPSELECLKIATYLRKHAFRENQRPFLLRALSVTKEKIKNIFESSPFQFLIALLIVMVSLNSLHSVCFETVFVSVFIL
jgi:hypothetical protein